MASGRKKYPQAQEVALVSQVDRHCPLCGEPLFYIKGNSSFKGYEIAHIYPLNPKPEEIVLLKNEEKLNTDVNHEDNLIPLCKKCHGKYDKPRTVEEYRRLYILKKELIEKSTQQALWSQYQIESDIKEIIKAIYNYENINEDCEITFEPKEVERKLNNSITRPTRYKIKNCVTTYFHFIRNEIAAMDKSQPDLSNLISSQIKSYYLKQKKLDLSQQKVFDNIVLWIKAKTNPQTNEAAEILTSFFIQNCEIFE